MRPLLATALLALVSCSSAPKNPTPDLVAHRGASSAAPENTLAAFAGAWAEGADAIEGDFRLTRDGQIVAIHDETTERTAGVNLTVSETTLSELRQLEYGAWKHERYAGEPIPSLAEVLASVPDGRRILIEIKTGPEIVPELQRGVQASGLERNQTIVIAFDEAVIVAVKAAMPWMRAYWLTGFEEAGEGAWEPTVESIIATAQQIGADGVDVEANVEVVDAEFVRQVRAAGLELHVWTVNKARHGRQMAALGVDSITTDRPGWLRRQIEAGQ